MTPMCPDRVHPERKHVTVDGNTIDLVLQPFSVNTLTLQTT